jgi:hypothetical protein
MCNPLGLDGNLKRSQDQSSLEPPAMRMKTEARWTAFPGAHRASNPSEINPAGKPAELRNNNKGLQGAIPSGNYQGFNLCGNFAKGKGCGRWPCGGAHACDVLIKKEKFRPCLGEHSRYNCPHNK